MRTQTNFQIKRLIVPAVIMLAFIGLGLWGWIASGYIQPLILFSCTDKSPQPSVL